MYFYTKSYEPKFKQIALILLTVLRVSYSKPFHPSCLLPVLVAVNKESPTTKLRIYSLNSKSRSRGVGVEALIKPTVKLNKINLQLTIKNLPDVVRNITM